MRIFEFKKYQQDFIVEEKIKDNIFCQKGDFLYVYIEKKNITTFDILYKLMNKFGLKRNDIGIAGLKDKKGITRQRISIEKKLLRKYGNKRDFVNFLGSISQVLSVKEGNELLKVGHNISNQFVIRLRKTSNFDQNLYWKFISQILEDIRDNGYPNNFGIQRFGREGKNYILGKKLLFGDISQHSLGKNAGEEAKFKIQALSSYLFNKYLDLRIQRGHLDSFLHGDIIMHKKTGNKLVYDKYDETIINLENFVPTGPCYGYDLLTSEGKVENNESFLLEMEILRKNGISLKDLDKFKKFKVFGIRRAIKEYVINLKYEYGRGDVLLYFELHSGAYASELVEYFDNELFYAINNYQD